MAIARVGFEVFGVIGITRLGGRMSTILLVAGGWLLQAGLGAGGRWVLSAGRRRSGRERLTGSARHTAMRQSTTSGSVSVVSAPAQGGGVLRTRLRIAFLGLIGIY